MFQHFNEFFNGCIDSDQVDYFADSNDHSSAIFYAFDLSQVDDMTAKAYFFPKMRARQRKQSYLEVLFQAIDTAPGVNKEEARAAAVFGDFCSDSHNKNLEYEMLAIDLIAPFESRIKLYFRTRETSFDSVINAMMLGGRIDNPEMQQGLRNLRKLWKAVLSLKDDQADCEPLQMDTSHRTAGILYNLEFRMQDTCSVAKIYIPVRHYARSDEAVIDGLCAYFGCDQDDGSPSRYREAINMLL